MVLLPPSAKTQSTLITFGRCKSGGGIPLILFDRTTDELDVSQVMINDYLGACKVVRHLVQQGCQRIAHLTSPKNISLYRERLQGYTKALRDHQIPLDLALVMESHLQLDDGRHSMQALLNLSQRPDAVFSASDYGAMGAMRVLKERGIKIPGEVVPAEFSIVTNLLLLLRIRPLPQLTNRV